jgi:hypothetical protein
VRRPPRIANPRHVGRLVCAVTALGLLTLPIQYRGGAEQPHAHAFVQIWLDAADGSFDHHRRAVADTQPNHAHDHGANGAEQAGGASAERRPEPARPRAALADAADAPQLSEITPALDRISIVLAVAALGLALVLMGIAPAWSAPVAWAGRRPSPETPPPRRALAPA